MRIEYIFLLPLLAALAITTLPVFASTGMGGGNDDDNPGEGDTHRDLVGNPDDEEDIEDDEKDRDGPGGESAEGDDEGEANCWGKVTSDAVSTASDEDDQDGEDDGIGGRAFGGHASNPTGDEDNDTPREGVGNQDEDHPSDHADAVGGAFSDEECAED